MFMRIDSDVSLRKARLAIKLDRLNMYGEPNAEKPCSKCEYYVYDSFHNETWCAHKPLADYIGDRCLIDRWGSCEYWKLSDVYKD